MWHTITEWEHIFHDVNDMLTVVSLCVLKYQCLGHLHTTGTKRFYLLKLFLIIFLLPLSLFFLLFLLFFFSLLFLLLLLFPWVPSLFLFLLQSLAQTEGRIRCCGAPSGHRVLEQARYHVTSNRFDRRIMVRFLPFISRCWCSVWLAGGCFQSCLVSHLFPGNVTCTPGFRSSLVVQVNGYSASSSGGIFCRFILTRRMWTSLVYLISFLFHKRCCCRAKCVLTKNSLLNYVLSLSVWRWKCFHLQFEKHFLFLYNRFLLLGVGLRSDHCRDAQQGQVLLQHSQRHQTVTRKCFG